MTPQPEQQTLAGEAVLEGTGLHSGLPCRLRLLPAEAGTGVRFRRTDLSHRPEIAASVDQVVSTDLGTTLGAGEVRVQTIEHLMAAVAVLEIDNLMIEMDGPEVPIMDGSFRPFLDLLRSVGSRRQSEPATVLKVTEALTVSADGGSSYVATPSSSWRISTSIVFDHPLIGRQFAAIEVDPAVFAEEIADARTFGFLRDAEALRERGLAKGATLENALVLDEEGLASGRLRFPDEFVRHKLGDVVGDLALLGVRLRGHVVADRPSHSGNVKLAKEIRDVARRTNVQAIVDIQKIMQYLPHRYPMLLVDRIVEFDSGKRIVGIKNVTINEPFFQGHYPGHPIMPGVLIIEAMAQVGGLLLMDAIENPEEKVVYFMSLDNVKWRRPVTPGDQIRIEMEMLQFRRHTCRMRGMGYVQGQLVAEAEMMARIVDR